MRVLDIDLDFFLNDCCPLAEKGKRPDLAGHEPWSEEKVRFFLESQCGLRTSAPVPGDIFETHDGALRFWRERIAEGKLQIPFHVTHVDAHSDLGIGYPGPGYVLDCVLPQPVEIRREIDRHYRMRQLDEANYLLFSLAFRWVDSLENVRNPKSREDLPQRLFKDEETILLNSFASRLMEGKNGKEPEIRFQNYPDYMCFRTSEPYDFVTLAMSPRYAPKEADGLASVVREYIR